MTVYSYKLKFYKDEENEFTESVSCEADSIKKLVSDYWTSNNFPNGLELIIISGNNNESMMLEHFGKDVFEVYYLPPGERFHYHKMSKIQLIHDSVDAFLRQDFDWLGSNLNKVSKDNRRVRNNIKTNDFEFTVTERRLWKEISLTIFGGIPLGLIFIIASAFVLFGLPHGSILDLIIPFLLFLGSYLWIPGLILHNLYRKDNDYFSIKLSKGQSEITINANGQQYVLHKDEIERVTIVKNPWYKLPWSDYGYTEIVFKSGDTLNLTNLLIDQFLIYEKLGNKNIEIRNTIYPRLKTSTSFNSTAANKKL
jgi:hypothetical protein